MRFSPIEDVTYALCLWLVVEPRMYAVYSGVEERVGLIVTGVLRVSIKGSLPNTEVWSVNPVFSLPTGDFPLTFDELNTIATGINGLTVPTAMRAWWSSSTAMTGVALEHRQTDGSLLAQLEQPRPAVASGTSAVALPMQTSVVSSLRTASSAATAKGRLYWPGTGAALVAASLRFDAGTLSAFRDAVRTYLVGIQGVIDTTSDGAFLCVWSRTLNSVQGVNRILLGNVPDVQRRRRDKAVESYDTLPYPA